jgi:hypothetical protein
MLLISRKCDVIMGFIITEHTKRRFSQHKNAKWRLGAKGAKRAAKRKRAKRAHAAAGWMSLHQA